MPTLAAVTGTCVPANAPSSFCIRWRAALVVSGYDGDSVRDIARQLGKAAPSARDVKVWGPTPAFYALLRGQTRERLLLQAAKTVDLQAYLKAWLALVKVPASVRVTVDVDPISFF